MGDTPVDFVYSPLPAVGHYIRLLKIEPSAPEEPLRFSLAACKFAEAPAYNSLSYEWGNNPPGQPILVNGGLFFVRENLHSFLKVLAGSAYRERYFFADAICINQDDIPERNAQVQRMGDLYAQAEEVLVWLGPGTAESDFIFDMCSDPAATSSTAESKPGEEKRRIEDLNFNEPDGEALDLVYQRSYWTRLWIIQELFLARKIVLFCGSKSTTWSVFKRLPRWNKADFVSGGFTGADMVLGSTPAGRHARDILDELKKREDGKAARTEKGLVELIEKFGHAQCSDARDHAYGLLGIASASGKHEEDRGVGVVADYSMSPATLFVRLLRTMPRKLSIQSALNVFNIMKLHHADSSAILASIPDALSSLSFEVTWTHIGHLEHTNRASLPACRPCHICARCSTSFELNEAQNQQLAGKIFSRITTGESQNTMATFGSGPLYEMIPYDSCVAAPGAREGDDVFLLQGTNVVLVLQQDDLGSTPRYMRGILCQTQSEQSISGAVELLDSCLSHLPSIEGVTLRTDNHRIWSLAGPVDFTYEELSLRQIVFLLVATGRHRKY